MSQSTITFKKHAGEAKQAFVIVFDLQGFSNFFRQPDVQIYVAKYLNKVFEAMDIIINGGTAYWKPRGPQLIQPFKKPDHVKFLGDGALYIWTFAAEDEDKIRPEFFKLCNHIWNFKRGFNYFLKECEDEVPVIELPKKIRFGISYGSVYKLHHSSGDQVEYIGYCINLAARLQSYCKDIGFIASARISIPSDQLIAGKYKKLIATKIRDFPSEYVFVDENEYEKLSKEVKDELFDANW